MASSSGGVAVGAAGSNGWRSPTLDVGSGSAVRDSSAVGSNDAASIAPVSPPNGQKMTNSAAAAIVAVVMAGVIVAVGMLVYAWRTTKRSEEEMFVDLGDESNYVYGDYAAM
ncbi:hypothetical protein PHYBOEH_001811 [Phytophthora boehmeriae]|uniref:Uncharacterized protein n=1 Tax=Phytophthora boehmeriae TaxID=109152 RepID=A0A8T1WRU3_9STRA|nr:hypothetical protein PHYBOEH_001811 [Phytophthora boehmeriae]